jgi:hypothetical protein
MGPHHRQHAAGQLTRTDRRLDPIHWPVRREIGQVPPCQLDG